MGHMSEDGTKERVESTDWWPKLEQGTKENERFVCGALHYHQIDREECSGDRRGQVPLHKKKATTPQDIVEVEDSPGPVKKIIKARKIRLNGKEQRHYLVRFKNQAADKDKWLAEDAIPDGNLHLRSFRPSRRTEQYHQ
ncbi:hypothetical protein O181_009359 [Austropuccinia psidii MF-1]|uniref:Chromo domain-containing protein n=1 Tax=Austropuccinia psidii MF-1 TaxID=1389203 RepID=A0A9Q3GJS7_9BASI|nr:hypothetical protein [Austropuccinia psidii MF-1]